MKPPARKALAIFLVFLAWQIMDFVIHGIMLTGLYEATIDLWRPMEEMKHGVMMLVALIAAAAFVLIYSMMTPKSLKAGIVFGVLFGVGTGIGMGFGTYSVQDIPITLAWSWLAAMVAESVVGGVIAAAIVKE